MKKSLGPRTLNYTAPVWIVGTYDTSGRPNGMAVSWGGICCSQPPCLNVSLRKATYSYASLVERQAFTVSVPSDEQVRAADYFGIASGRDVDKFAAAGLTPVRSDRVEAPYVGEFPLVLECRVRHSLEIGLHTLFVGEILDVKAEESVLGPSGFPAVELLRPFVYCPGIKTYQGLAGPLGRAFDIGRTPKD